MKSKKNLTKSVVEKVAKSVTDSKKKKEEQNPLITKFLDELNQFASKKITAFEKKLRKQLKEKK